MPYEDWQQRVVDERTALEDKVTKLKAFVSTEAHNALDAAEQSRMATQLHHMTGYLRTLEERVANFVAKETT